MKKKVWKILALAIAIALIIGVCLFANALVGNPVSKMLANKAAESYLTEIHPGTDFFVERVGFNFKDGKYYAHIRSDSSIDTQFTIHIDMLGNVRYDTFDSVLDKFVTARRLEQEYRELADSVLDSAAFPYPTDIGYGTLEIYPEEAVNDPLITDDSQYALIQEDLIIDKIYDIRELGARAGHLVIYVDCDTVSLEKAAEVLLTIREEFDNAAIPFRAVSFTLRYPKPPEGRRQEGGIEIRHFPYDGIYADGLADRIRIADEELKAYYAAQDAKGVK